MEPIEFKLERISLLLEKIETKILRKIMEKEDEEKLTSAHIN
jgi:hypothetical protein